MADNINIKDSGGTVIPVATDEVTTLNGATVAAVDVQRIKLGYGIDGSYQDVDPTHPAPVTDTALGTSLASLVAASHTDLAAILAKLSADPATQTTLAAILAKLTADPATQTTLAAVLAKLSGDPATQTTLAAVLAKLNGSLAVNLPASTATAFADAGTITAGTYRGITVKNTSTTATAEVAIRNQNVTGTILDTITLAGNESVRETYPAGRAAASGTIYMQLVGGAVSGSVFAS